MDRLSKHVGIGVNSLPQQVLERIADVVGVGVVSSSVKVRPIAGPSQSSEKIGETRMVGSRFVESGSPTISCCSDRFESETELPGIRSRRS